MRGESLTRLACLLGAVAVITVPCVELKAQQGGPQPAAPAESGQPGELRVLVFDDQGRPVPNASVRIERLTVRTNAQGATELELEPGTYRVQISAEGLLPAQLQDIKVKPGSSIEVIATLGRKVEMDVESGGEAQKQEEVQSNQGGVPGKVTGKVTELDKNKPIVGAKIYVRGQPIEVTTDTEGRFELELPAGTYDLSLIHPRYSSEAITDVEVIAEDTVELDIKMAPAVFALDDFVVTAPRIEGGTAALLEVRKEATTLGEVIGAEQFAKSGDSSAAAALKRVTGLTVVGGKFIYVRGMGERYSSTLLDGSTLPSPDPERRVVPLDLFPTDLLESITVQKTYSPDMPGEFGGGVVQLETRKPPDEFEFKVGASTAMVTGMTFTEGLTYEGSATDFLGFDSARGLPPLIADAAGQGNIKRGSVFSPEQIEQFGESLPSIYTPRRFILPPDFGLSLTLGDSWKLGDQTKLGVRFGFGYDHEWRTYRELFRGFYRIGEGGALETRNAYDFEETTRHVVASGILSTVLSFNDKEKIWLTSVLTRVSDDETRVYDGFNRDALANIEVTRLRWIERQLWFNQIGGIHILPGFFDSELTWRYVYSQAQRGEPDNRQQRYRFDSQDNNFVLSNLPEGNQRFFSDLIDNNQDISVDLKVPYKTWADLEANLRSGFQFVYKDRIVDTRRLKFDGANDLNPLFRNPPEQIFTPENITASGEPVELTEITRNTDNYEANQLLVGAYLMTTLPIAESIDVTGGLRLEYSRQIVETFVLFAPVPLRDGSELEATDLLPALNATWRLPGDMQVRAALSRTVSRPDFRELSPAAFTDVAGGNQTEGNPDLERGLLTHYDLRWEWYPKRGESFSVAAFYKDFTNPIEQVLIPGAQRTLTYQNALGAVNFGLELDARKTFDFLGEGWEDMYIAGNAALIQSNISLDPATTIQTNTERPLQGQSPYVVNVQYGYDNVDLGLSLTLLYNVFGSRVSQVGAQGQPDIFERPFQRVDFVGRKTLGEFAVGFKAKNLFDPLVRFTQGNQRVETFRRGREISLSLSWSPDFQKTVAPIPPRR